MTDQPNLADDPNAGQQPPASPPVAQPPVPPAPPAPPSPPSGMTPPPPPATPGMPPPPPGAYPSDGAAAGPVNADVGGAFSWAGNKFGKYALVLIGLAAVVFVIRLIGTLVQHAIVNSLIGNCSNTVVINGQVVTTGVCTASLVQNIIAGAIVAIIFGVLAWIATIGIYRAALKTTLGETPGFHNLTTGENLGKYIVVAIVYGLLIGLGFVLCILPGIIAAFLFQLAPFYALDKGYGVSDALGNSFRATTQNFVPTLLMTLINIVVAIVGSILFGLLTLVALPFAALFTAHMYRQFNREQIAA